MAKQMTQEQLETAQRLLAEVSKSIIETLVPVLNAMSQALVEAGIIDKDGNLTEQSKQLLKEIDRNG